MLRLSDHECVHGKMVFLLKGFGFQVEFLACSVSSQIQEFSFGFSTRFWRVKIGLLLSAGPSSEGPGFRSRRNL